MHRYHYKFVGLEIVGVDRATIQDFSLHLHRRIKLDRRSHHHHQLCIININKSSFPFSIMSYESLEDLVLGNALRIGRVAIALFREVREVAQIIWQAMEGRSGGVGGQHRAQWMEAAMERLELEAEATEEHMEDEARRRAWDI